MAINNQEIEIKFKIKDAKAIREKLKKAKAEYLGRVFERTLRFDTEKNDLEKEGKFLRLRTGFSNTLTFKRKINHKEYKKREEIEIEISDLEKMSTILKRLNYTKILTMEKYREKWLLEDIEIVIDKLPMGEYIEIEGEEDKIEEMIFYFGLKREERILCTYWDLWHEFTRKNNINEKNIIFNYK